MALSFQHSIWIVPPIQDESRLSGKPTNKWKTHRGVMWGNMIMLGQFFGMIFRVNCGNRVTPR